MTIVETFGLYHYEITGDREQEAAQELEQRLDFISRQYWQSSEAQLDDIASARERIAQKYGVEIRTEI